ncbi:MAG: hypothetical protein F4187_01190, partial [Gemmatimonadetes bacterium]|nr:hypothetical protein [Gemmatimonadota bacterium]
MWISSCRRTTWSRWSRWRRCCSKASLRRRVPHGKSTGTPTPTGEPVRIEEQFTVAAPAEEVWAFLTDPERVAAALPGAEINEQIDENTYSGGMAVKVGPLAAAYTGTVAFELD